MDRPLVEWRVTLIERTLDRDRFIVLAGLSAATLVAWVWIVPMSFDMYGPMSESAEWMTSPAWDVKYVLLLFAMWLSSSRAASAVLALAGVYQLTPLKRTCLSACQSPLTFIARHWQKGLAGAFRMGVAHGVFCIGCCWALMLLLFAGGVMHLTTIGLLTIVVLVEKVLPSESSAQWFAWATGSLLLALAVWMLI